MSFRFRVSVILTFRTVKYAVIAAVICLTGCRSEPDYESIPVFPARGQLFVNGVAAEGAIVRLHPQTPQSGAEYPLLPVGRVDAEGNFELTTYENADGAPAGTYKLTIRWPDPSWRPKSGPPPQPPDRLKKAYEDPKSSDYTVTITEGDNALEAIRLENVAILDGSSLPSAGN